MVSQHRPALRREPWDGASAAGQRRIGSPNQVLLRSGERLGFAAEAKRENKPAGHSRL